MTPFLRIFAISLVLGLTSVQAQTNQDAVLLTIAGKVEVAKAGGDAWTAGQANLGLKIGDKVRTGKSSRATLRLSNLSVIRVYESSTLEIQPPQQAGHSAGMDLKSGAAYFFNRDKPMETQFRTPSASGAIRGTEFALNVDANGHTEVALIDGQVDLKNDQGSIELNSGEKGTADMGKAPQKTALINAVNIIQWTLYYPAILNVDELELGDEIKDSVAAYRSGDLLGALAKYPEGRVPMTDAEKIYHAALLLAVGQVDEAEKILPAGTPQGKALAEMIATVRGQTGLRAEARNLATEWLAGSYSAQAKQNLTGALEMAKKAVEVAPLFGFALERLAEMEFSFGHTTEALAALDKSLAAAPKNAQALALKGFLLSAQNKIGEAGQYFEQAIAADGSLANAWLGRGLVRIKTGEVDAGRKDLHIAASLEPNRAILRSYLGKAWSMDEPFRYTWSDHLAEKELGLAKKLDPNDPTAWLYSALLNDQRNRINQALDDLEKSQDLNNNRSVFRSKMLLDQDRAVRSANLATIYRDAGFTDLSVREATKSLSSDYANYSAHLFLSESYDAIRDPQKRNLRYETPWLNELLVANLLAPVGAGAISQNISQQEYSRLFEADRPGVSSRTEYMSTGDWLEEASQFGTYKDFAYSLDAYYNSQHGNRPNDDITDSDFSAKVKVQATSRDTAFFQIERTETKGGDTSQYYDPTRADKALRSIDREEPNLLFGYHREWSPSSHTIFLYRHVEDNFNLNQPNATELLVFGTPLHLVAPPADYVGTIFSDAVINSTELQQIFETDKQALILGGRYQFGEIQSGDNIYRKSFAFTKLVQPGQRNTLDRVSFYTYYQLKVLDSLRVTGGVAYDRLHYPLNIDQFPVSPDENTKERFSPKLGAEWTPWDRTRFHGAYTRSMGGALNDANTLIEPTEVGGFNQTFRSLIPESVAGRVGGSVFETWGLGVDHAFPTRTYVDVEGQLLNSWGAREDSAFTSPFIFPLPITPTSTPHSFGYREKSLQLSVSQLLGTEWAVGARYHLGNAHLFSSLTAVNVSTTTESTLHELTLFANYNLPCGFFSQAEAVWSAQSNKGFLPAEPGDAFWHLNLYAGYRFPRRHAEVKVGLLNITGDDYRLEPLNYHLDQVRGRTLAASFKFNF